jgi:ABC-2 type transport system permease protein
MDATAPPKPARIKRWLPYWAVFQADLHQTLRSWVYLFWVMVSVLGASGYLLYRVGIEHEAGMVQTASALISDLLRWSVLGSITLIIALTGGSISSERGTLADSVLSRGISRYQYFLAKWHARLVTVLSTFVAMGIVALAGSFLFLHRDLDLRGSLVALVTIIALLATVTTCGVTVSAIANSTMLGITILWVVLYGAGFAMSLLPAYYPSPDRILNSLPNTLRGLYDISAVGRLVGWSALASGLVASIGFGYFSRRDI